MYAHFIFICRKMPSCVCACVLGALHGKQGGYTIQRQMVCLYPRSHKNKPNGKVARSIGTVYKSFVKEMVHTFRLIQLVVSGGFGD